MAQTRSGGGFYILRKAFMKLTELGPGEKLVLLALADYRSAPRGICPSIATLAREAGLSQRAVQGILQRLKERGLISIAEQRDPHGDPAPNQYRLLKKATDMLDGGGEETAPGGEETAVPKEQHQGGEETAPGGTEVSAPGGGAVSASNSELQDSDRGDSERDHSIPEAEASSPSEFSDRLAELGKAEAKAREKSASADLSRRARAARNAKNLNGDGKPTRNAERQELNRLIKLWFDLLREKFPDTPVPKDEHGRETLSPREAANLGKLMKLYSGKHVEHAIKYLLTTWESFKARVLKGTGTVPTVSLLYGFESTIIGEAQRWVAVSEVHEEWTSWFKKNPNKRPPADLERRYEAVQPELKSLGLTK